MDNLLQQAMKGLFPSVPQGQPLQRGQGVSSFPGYATPQPAPQQANLSGIGNILGAFGSTLNNLNPFKSTQAAPLTPKKANFDAQMSSKGWSRGADGVYRMGNTPSATPSAMPTPSATPTPQGVIDPKNFRFQMGQSDYSYVKPQLQRLFEAKGNPPLAQFMDHFIQAGNKYGVDPRVLITIANNESSLGRNYPAATNNPFGYLVGGGGVQGLQNAGFTSVPMAIEALTRRFNRPGTPQGYTNFRQNPTIEALQAAYNANPAERDIYLQNSSEILPYFQ